MRTWLKPVVCIWILNAGSLRFEEQNIPRAWTWVWDAKTLALALRFFDMRQIWGESSIYAVLPKALQTILLKGNSKINNPNVWEMEVWNWCVNPRGKRNHYSERERAPIAFQPKYLLLRLSFYILKNNMYFGFKWWLLCHFCRQKCLRSWNVSMRVISR